MTKDEARLSVMGAISMALKDPTLQQGFEIICKNLAEFEEKSEKETAHRIRNFNKAIEWKEKCRTLKKENAELKEQNRSYGQLIEAGSVTLMKDRLKNYKQLSKAKELLKEWVNSYDSMNIALCKKSQNFLEEVEE